MQTKMLLAVALLMVVSIETANACEETNYASYPTSVTADGTSVVFESDGSVRESVRVVTGRGSQLATCTIGEDTSWKCNGDRLFRATGKEDSTLVVRRWNRTLGSATAALTTTTDAPKGIVEAFCARIDSLYIDSNETKCDTTTAEVLESANAPGLVFLRFAVERKFCGATSSYSKTYWLTREALALRLERRTAVFTVRERSELANSAREALAWLSPTGS